LTSHRRRNSGDAKETPILLRQWVAIKELFHQVKQVRCYAMLDTCVLHTANVVGIFIFYPGRTTWHRNIGYCFTDTFLNID